MLYLDQVVEVPQHGVTLVYREHFIYVKQYADDWKNSDGSKNTNRRQPIIGRLVQADPKCTQMYPNEQYFVLRDLPLPPRSHSRLGTPGRKSNTVYAQGTAVYPGFALLCAAALMDCGAYALIKKHFGEILGEQIMFMATHYAAGHHSLECLDFHALRHNVLPHARGMTKQRGSELLAGGIPGEYIDEFFTDWIRGAAGNDPIAYDVTALPTRARELVLAQRGYAHGDPELPQINYALMVNSRTGMPVFFSHYHGSITDKANLQYVVDRAVNHNLPGSITLVFDRDFASLKNISGLRKKGLRFIMGVPATLTTAMERLDEFSRINEFAFEDIILDQGQDGTYCESDTVGKTEDFEWNGEKLRLHLYRSSATSLKKNARLHSSVLKCKEFLEKTGSLPEGSEFAEALSFFHQEGRGRGIKWVFDEEVYLKTRRNHGCFALISSPQCHYTTQQALYLFRSREIDEEMFNCLKTDLNCLPLSIGGEASLDGKFFVLFVSAIIRHHLLLKLNDILSSEHAGFNRLSETMESRMFELRGDGSVAPSSIESTFEAAVFARICGPELAKELGLQEHYVIKPKRRSGRKTK